MNHYLACWKKYAVFTGRASRREFWSWAQWNLALFLLPSLLLIFVTTNALEASAPGQTLPPPIAAVALFVIVQLYILLSLLPSIGVTIRRLHDQNRSGWWILLALLPSIWGRIWPLDDQDSILIILLNGICVSGGIILLVIQTTPGTEGENRFGAPPAS